MDTPTNTFEHTILQKVIPNSKVHGANMGHTWVLSAPDGSQIGQWTFLPGIAIRYRM